MKTITISLLFSALVSLNLVSSNLAYGNEETFFDEERNRTIEYQLIFPETTDISPLVVLSHGSSGSFSDFKWLTNHLLENGFAVLGLNHPFNTAKNNTPRGEFRLWDRPKHVSNLLNHLLNDEAIARRIDNTKIAIAGFSAGAYTGLALVGETISLEKQTQFCEQTPKDPVCLFVDNSLFHDPSSSDAGETFYDPRIKAVFAMAPPLGTAAEISSLSEITAPIFLIAAEDDSFLPTHLHTKFYAEHIPSATTINDRRWRALCIYRMLFNFARHPTI